MSYTPEQVEALIARSDPDTARRNREKLATLDAAAAYVAQGGAECGKDTETPQKRLQGQKRGNPEARIVQAIRKALIEAGYRVYKINQRWIPGETHFANDAGIPDLLVTRRAYPGMPCLPFFVGMEIKVPGGNVTIEQARGAMDGNLFVVEDAEEALAIMGEIERRSGE